MKKKPKLPEKASRVSDTRQLLWEKVIPQYLQEIEPLNSESARSHRFAMLVQELLGLEPGFIESYSVGIEKYLKVKQKDRILKGKADNLFGNVVIEFEANLPKNREEAEEQLKRYAAILWSQERPDTHTPYLCVATDGVRFVTYSPAIIDPTAKDIIPEKITLQLLEESDWTKIKPTEVFYWLDRYFLRKELLHPTSEAIVHDFGVQSHALQTATHSLLILWQELKSRSAFSVIYESWDKYLRIVYGSEVAGDELFIRHTYLATLAKLMAWKRITESTSLPEDAQIIRMLEGRLFKDDYGIENFIEEDFFSWLVRPEARKVAVGVTRWLFSLLQNYRLRELSEDVLKSLYQELVDPKTRHDLGEFYTPDWLAHRMVDKLLEANPNGSVLDPACGSGTFLYLTIREKRQRLKDSTETLRHIIDSVYGADIHPLAVIISKTNYILALGDLLKKRRKGAITIPIYLADSIKLPERWMKTKTAEYEVVLNGRVIYLPESLFQNLPLYDQAIELSKEFARQNKGKTIALEPFRNFLAAQNFPSINDDSLIRAIFAITKELKYFIDIDRDTIWAFVLKNNYKPLFFKHKFDFIVGNPPWIAFRFMEPAYQAFLKKQIVNNYRLLKGRGELITHLEVASLFLVRSADLYLKSGGSIAFVLPKSLFSADQHDGLRQRTFKFYEDGWYNLSYSELWDFEKVAPLFKVPACVLIAERHKDPKVKYPIPGQILSGKLERKNESLFQAKEALSVQEVEFSIHTRGKRSYWATEKGPGVHKESYYKRKFAQGATIVPRSFWFVQIKPSSLGFNPNLPPLETAERAKKEAKDTYKSVILKDTVESRFLYATLLSTDLLPFGHLGYRLVVLPIEPKEKDYELLDATKARNRGFLHLANWLEKAGKEWVKRRGAKVKDDKGNVKISVVDWLDYRHKLTVQNPQAKYKVIYNASGTNIVATLIKNEIIEFEINGQSILTSGYIADTKTYFCELNNKDEALFLLSIFNSPIIDKLIKPMQSRGLWGPRDIHKKVLELPIPKFDMTNPTHRRLAELGQECSEKVAKYLAGGGTGKIKSIGKLRGMVREMLKKELKEIDVLVHKILK